MANPQLENGYVKIANELWDAMTAYRLSGEQMQCFMVILRKTYGWNKKKDAIALSQFVEATGLKKPNVVRAISGLKDKRMIIVIKKDNAPANIYSIIKDFVKWKPLSKKIMKNMPGRVSIEEIKSKIRKRDSNVCVLCGFDGMLNKQFLPVHHIDFNQTNNNDNNLITLCKSCHARSHTVIQKDKLSKMIMTVIKNDNPSLSKMIPTKDTTTKDTITKDITRKRKTLISANYQLSDQHIKYAKSKGLNLEKIEDEFEGFYIHHKKVGNKYADWYAAWQTWVRNYLKFNKSKKGTVNDDFSSKEYTGTPRSEINWLSE